MKKQGWLGSSMIDFKNLSSIAPDTIWRYLESLGWKKRTSKDGRMLRFTYGELIEPIHLYFTIRATNKTRKIEISTAISTLEQIYEISPSDIIRASTSLLFDLIKATIPDSYVSNDTINLKTASSFIFSLKDFLASSATTETSEERSFLRNSKASVDYANECRFGHTFKGSFGFVIESPVGAKDEQNMAFIDQQPPHGRKVVERISNSFVKIREAKMLDSINPIVDYDSGISSNMCDDLVSMLENTGIHKVNFSFTLSAEWESSLPFASENHFDVEVKDIEMLKEASLRIRGTNKDVPAIVMGTVSRLEASGAGADILSDNSTREVVINWDSQDYGRIKVKVSLSAGRYLDAIRAHSEGRPYLARGLLTKSGRSWVLKDIKEARVMS